MPDTFTPDPQDYRLYIELDGELGGFTEKHNLGIATTADALTMAQLILSWRQVILPTDMQISYATIRLPGPPRDSIIVGTAYPLIGMYSEGTAGTPTAGSDSVNLDNDCLTYRKQGGLGSFSTCFLHGIPDSHITKGKLAFPVVMATTIPPTIPTMPAPTPLWEQHVGEYLAVIAKNTQLDRVSVDNTGNKVYSKAPISTCVFRRVTDKKVGIPTEQQRGRRSPR